VASITSGPDPTARSATLPTKNPPTGPVLLVHSQTLVTGVNASNAGSVSPRLESGNQMVEMTESAQVACLSTSSPGRDVENVTWGRMMTQQMLGGVGTTGNVSVATATTPQGQAASLVGSKRAAPYQSIG